MENGSIFKVLVARVGLPLWQVEQTVRLLDDGGTVPFISRYRKEITGGLDEVQVQAICSENEHLKEFVKRKEYVLKTISDLGKLTDEIRIRIDSCWDSTELEDIYLPFKPKRRTKAEIARNNGLEPLAKIIMSQHGDDIVYRARKFLNENVATVEDAIQGAKDIIAEWISENIQVRNKVRLIFSRSSVLGCKVVKGKEQEGEKYSNYFSVTEPLRKCSSHRLLAMLRGEKEGYLKLQLTIDDDDAVDRISRVIVKSNTASSNLVAEAVADAYKRLIKPSIETETLNNAKLEADKVAIDTFAQNLRQLLFAPPLGNKRVLGIDPGYRTGCKVVCLDEQGSLLHNDVIYPTPPKIDIKGAASKIKYLVEAYKIDAIAVGNGTASRETERFLSSLRYSKDIKVFVVNESGASIYSASKIARDEFPDKDVTVRGAVSIGRRLLDPLAELVKIDPKSIGVGQYQHDVDQNLLKDSLTFTVESCVNSVGVNINTASKELLTYVAGIGPQLAQNIVNYRAENGAFATRRDIMKVPRLGAKAYQQSAAFLRIPESENPLDNSAVHPERYALVEKMAKDCCCSVVELIKDEEKRSQIDIKRYIDKEVGEPTLIDILKELEKPGRDPRKGVKVLEFDENVKTIEDLKEGMILNGIVTNITQFGVFVDIGVHENGLIHISELCDHFISSPSEVVELNQHVKVKVKSVELDRKRISLSMKGL